MTLEIHGNPTKNPQRRTASSWSPGGQGIIYVLIYRNQPTKKPCCHQSHKKTSKLSVFLRSHQKKRNSNKFGGVETHFPKAPRNPPRDPPTTRRKKPSCLHPHLMQCHGPRRRPRSVSSLWVLCLGKKALSVKRKSQPWPHDFHWFFLV